MGGTGRSVSSLDGVFTPSLVSPEPGRAEQGQATEPKGGRASSSGESDRGKQKPRTLQSLLSSHIDRRATLDARSAG